MQDNELIGIVINYDISYNHLFTVWNLLRVIAKSADFHTSVLRVTNDACLLVSD